MAVTHALLGLLLPGERHGYELKTSVDREFAPFWRIDFGQMYRSLAKMRRAGWVSVHTQAGDHGPERKVYQITPLGKRAFVEWLETPPADQNELFLKLRFASERNASPPAWLEPHRHALEAERATREQARLAAQQGSDLGRVTITQAALRETESGLASLDFWAQIRGTHAVPSASPSTQAIIIGSDDPLLSLLALRAHAQANSVGSINGLLALGQHQAHAAGIHLRDSETGEYNTPFIRHLLPEDEIILVNLAFRENGLLIARSNPKQIRTLRDLARPGVRFINRQRGAGTRLLLHSRLRAANIDPHSLHNWEWSVTTHDGIGAAVSSGAADAGPGLRATAAAWGLNFLPLGDERYDLAIPAAEYRSARLRPLLEALNSVDFRRAAATLEGYDLSQTGHVIARVK